MNLSKGAVMSDIVKFENNVEHFDNSAAVAFALQVADRVCEAGDNVVMSLYPKRRHAAEQETMVYQMAKQMAQHRNVWCAVNLAEDDYAAGQHYSYGFNQLEIQGDIVTQQHEGKTFAALSMKTLLTLSERVGGKVLVPTSLNNQLKLDC